MELKTILTCPLGAKCEEIKDDAIHRCVWLQTFAGMNPSTGEQVDEKGCAMAWLPILMIENSKQQRSTSVAVESFRNEMVKSQEASQQVLLATAFSKPQTLKYVEEE